MDSNHRVEPMEIKPLPELIVKQIYQYGSQGRAALENGHIDQAEKYFLLGWGCIPEPKIDYDFAQTLSRGLVEFYRETAQYQKAKDWIEITRSAYDRPQPDERSTDYVDFIAAKVYFDAEELEAAFIIFNRQFKKYKTRPFQGDDKNILIFTKKKCKISVKKNKFMVYFWIQSFGNLKRFFE